MLFISPHPGYILAGIKQQKNVYHEASGELIDTIPGIDAEFIHGGVPEWAQEIALENKQFQQRWGGLPEGVDPRMYIAKYDTRMEQDANGWDDETREMVENTLLKHSDFGSRYVVAETPKELDLPPWPNYDDIQWRQIVPTGREIGADFEYILAYEREHKNRPGVIEQLLEALGQSPDLVAA